MAGQISGGCPRPHGRAAALSPPELSNVEFHCGRAEDLVPALVSRLASQQLMAILDPPRAGLREWCPPEGWCGEAEGGPLGCLVSGPCLLLEGEPLGTLP